MQILWYYTLPIQNNKVKGSYHMEKEDLLQCMKLLGDHGLQVDALITDRHKQGSV